MRKTGKTYIYMTGVLLLAWLLPQLYNLFAPKYYQSPFTLYSCVLDDFTTMVYGQNNELSFQDRQGNLYKGTRFDSVQPMFYCQQAFANGTMPDSIKGRKITPELVKHNNFFLSQMPRDVNRPGTGLYMVMESQPARLELESPEEVFRSTSQGLEFVEMATNRKNADRSEAFTAELLRNGFVFPAVLVEGNPTVRKHHDEGYFLTDKNGLLFHMKQVSGKPYVKQVPLQRQVKHVLVTEIPNRQTLAYLVDDQSEFCILDSNYTVTPTGIRYDPENDNFLMIGDLFYYTLKTDDGIQEKFYALDAHSYAVADTMTRRIEGIGRTRVEQCLFPVQLDFTSGNDLWVYPRLSGWSARALVLNAVLAGIFLFCGRHELRRRWLPALCLLFLGIYLFIPLLLMGDLRESR